MVVSGFDAWDSLGFREQIISVFQKKGTIS
jgi:hypothetical protein